MPPWILAAIPIVLAALGVLTLIIRPIARMWAEKLADRDLERMIAALKGAVAIARPIAASTPTNVDDQIVNGVLDAALSEFVGEYGRRPKTSAQKLQNVATAVVTDNAAAVGALTGVPVGVSVGYLGKLKARP